MKEKYNLALYGAGGIAGKFAEAAMENERIVLYAVASRNMEHAVNFAKVYKIENTFDTYEMMLNDKRIDLVYVSTPTKFHYEHIKQCLMAEKNVICEKPFVETEEQAVELIQLAQEKNLLLIDALWTMYMPIMEVLHELISQIGTIKFSSASLGYPSVSKEENNAIKTKYDLWDYEVYPLATTLLLCGEPTSLQSRSKYIGDIMVKNTSKLKFADGVARIGASLLKRSTYVLLLLGTKGSIIARKWWFGRFPVIVWKYPFKFKVMKFHHEINGYEYELDETIKCMDENIIESSKYSLKNTLQVLKWSKEIKKEKR